VTGALDDGDVAAATIARDTPARVVSVGYPLSPQFPFPIALEDGYRALQWTVASARAKGVTGRFVDRANREHSPFASLARRRLTRALPYEANQTTDTEFDQQHLSEHIVQWRRHEKGNVTTMFADAATYAASMQPPRRHDASPSSARFCSPDFTQLLSQVISTTYRMSIPGSLTSGFAVRNQLAT
jgi:hypothetical protein